MARNIELVSKSFKLSEEVAQELTKLIFGERSSNAAALSKFSHFDKEILETLRESIDPEWKVETKEVVKEEKTTETKEVVKEESTVETDEEKSIDSIINSNIIPFKFQKKEDKKPLEEKTTETKEEVKEEKTTETKEEVKEESTVETKEEVKEESTVETKQDSADFRPVAPEEVAHVLNSIITRSISDIPDSTMQYLNGVFEGIKKLDFSKIKSNSEFDKKINSTLTKLVDPIAASLDAAGYNINKEVLKEQFCRTADGIDNPLTLTKKFVYNPQTSIRRIISAFDMDADIAKDFRSDLKSCIKGMEFQNVEEFQKNVVEQHEQVFAPIYAKYVLQENLKYAYDNSKDNPFELSISLKESSDSPEDSFVVGEEVSPEELQAQINEVLDSGSGEVVVTKRKWKRKDTTNKK